jgi:hypothetical protein
MRVYSFPGGCAVYVPRDRDRNPSYQDDDGRRYISRSDCAILIRALRNSK